MDNGRRIFDSLYQIGFDRILQKNCHSAVRLQITGIHRRALSCICNKDTAKPAFQIRQVVCQTQNRHHFAGNGDHEMILSGNSVRRLAQSYNHIAQRPVIGVSYPSEHNAPLINI